MKRNRLIIMGEQEHVITHSSIEELQDKLDMLPKYIRDCFNMSKMLGAANANPMAGGYASSFVVQNNDTAFNTAAKVVAIYNGLSAAALVRTVEYTVLPRYMITWGSGILGAINNQGYLYMGVFKAGSSIGVNTQLLKVESADRQRQQTVRQFNDTECNLGVNTSYATMTPTNNQAQMIALPQTTVIAAPYSRLAVDSIGVVVATNSDSYFQKFPITVKSA